ncbi:MAG: hypothetical protein ACFFDW_10755, partial [Candidatus Thorarchaeota archaeon]
MIRFHLQKKFNKRILLFSILILLFIIPIIINQNKLLKNVRGHIPSVQPEEIFSFWNNTLIPLIDGTINFNTENDSYEWAPASIYNLFNSAGNPNGKLLLQNDNSYLYIGMDLVNQHTIDPVTDWGMSVYIDIDHNGYLSGADRAIRYSNGSISDDVYFFEYSTSLMDWSEIESGALGEVLPISNVKVDSSFTKSVFEENDHRQYEIKIPLSLLKISLGNITGFAIESFENFNGNTDEVSWPYVGADPQVIRENARLWGDFSLGKQNFISELSIENNFNIKTSAIGINNGTLISTADIDNNGDLEII